MSTVVWVPVLMAAVWAAHWGAEHMGGPLKKLRRQWGFSTAAGGSFVGLAAASPETGINIASAVQGVSDIGLGAMLGSNIFAIPLVVTVGYLALRMHKIDDGYGGRAHRHLLPVDDEAATVQALPYLAIVALVALLTLPAPWRGLQPIDGWIMLAAYAAYLGQAILRRRRDGNDVTWGKREIWLTVAGFVALAVGAYFTVWATENIVSTLGIPRIIGGLFIAAPMAALPEVLTAWSVAKSGEITAAVTSVIGDNAVTMTVAFLPLALISAPMGDFQLFWINLLFVGLMPALYAAFLLAGGRKRGFRGWHAIVLDGILAIYLIVILLWALNVL